MPATSWIRSPKTTIGIQKLFTLLARLVQKGVVGFKKEGRAYVYDALKSEPDCVRDESETFLKRVFRGDLNSLFSYFIQKRKLSASQLSELRRLVRSK